MSSQHDSHPTSSELILHDVVAQNQLLPFATPEDSSLIGGQDSLLMELLDEVTGVSCEPHIVSRLLDLLKLIDVEDLGAFQPLQEPLNR